VKPILTNLAYGFAAAGCFVLLWWWSNPQTGAQQIMVGLAALGLFVLLSFTYGYVVGFTAEIRHWLAEERRK
jgi:hypothetical protein